MPGPSVSIIIVTADRPAEVQRCLTALQPQLNATAEVLIVDASHDDATARLTATFPRGRYLRSPVRNMCAQRNLGVRAAGGDIVAFVDDDAIPQPGWLAALLAGYGDSQITSVVGAVREDGLPVGGGTQRTAFGLQQQIDNWPQLQPTEVLNGRGANMSFRKATLEQAGWFDENYRGHCNGEERDVFVRVRRAGGRVLYVPAAAVIHQPGPTAGYVRSRTNARYVFMMARNNSYGNAKLFFGRREFFWYFIVDTLRFTCEQLGRLLRNLGGNLAVLVAFLAGKLCGFASGLKYRLTK
jgi:GT2 family glycosyltransferase